MSKILSEGSEGSQGRLDGLMVLLSGMVAGLMRMTQFNFLYYAI